VIQVDSDEAKVNISIYLGTICAVVFAFWSIGYFWHVGPPLFSIGGPWWALPYFLTAILFGISVAILVGAFIAWLAYCVMNRIE
jgi:hypothetical protein